MFEQAQKTMRWLVFVSAAVTLLATAFAFSMVWLYAPEVGGSYWPYIRFGVSFVAALITAKIFWVISVFVSQIYASKKMMTHGSEEAPWDEEQVEDFISQFED